ncbi:hypothetical protein M407DRAFT_26358 [Tulasnella calospora MUT 4182]|uniref:Uncharacterized protein n=1 Tax=Tulasnella calospora MUT 4182 TaxID=1051891 RepID=A0A0C3KS17_9AGAM|nr:hypothetical protein M407DRAFT_26358 [Tulasnella calospora MUT 4182]
MSSSRAPPLVSSNLLVPTLTKRDFGILCDEVDSEAFRTQYLPHEQWSAVEVIPDDAYNSQNHTKKRYIAMCRSDSLLRLAYQHLRLQGVQTENRVEGRAVKAVAAKLKSLVRLLEEEPSGDVVGPVDSSPSPTSMTGSTNDVQDTVQIDHSTTDSLNCTAAADRSSGTNAASPVSNARSLPQPAPTPSGASSTSLTQRPALPSNSQPPLPPPHIPPVHEEDSVLTVEYAKKRFMQRKEEATTFLKKPNLELADQREQLREAYESMEDAKRDYDDKENIQKFLSQYSDRPIVPEYWAYDTQKSRYTWVGPYLDFNGDEADKPKVWKGYNY